jgi:hypothetical protein
MADDFRSWALFSIRGHIIPEQITRELELQPDRVYHDGQERVWQINSTLGALETTENHFHQLLDKLLPRAQVVRKLAQAHRAEFYCFLEKPSDMSLPISLSPRILMLCGYLRAYIDVEVKDFEQPV